MIAGGSTRSWVCSWSRGTSVTTTPVAGTTTWSPPRTTRRGDLVEIIYGSAGGLSTKHSRGWDLDSPGIQGEMSTNGTSFGTALATGRFDGREHDGLVIGDDAYDEGLFVVINGSPSGLTVARNRLWTADDFRQPGLMYLGKALTSG